MPEKTSVPFWVLDKDLELFKTNTLAFGEDLVGTESDFALRADAPYIEETITAVCPEGLRVIVADLCKILGVESISIKGNLLSINGDFGSVMDLDAPVRSRIEIYIAQAWEVAPDEWPGVIG